MACQWIKKSTERIYRSQRYQNGFNRIGILDFLGNSMFSILLFSNLLLQAQSPTKEDRIVGYWKEMHLQWMGNTPYEVTTYSAFSSDSIAHYVTLYLDKYTQGTFVYQVKNNSYSARRLNSDKARLGFLFWTGYDGFKLEIGNKTHSHTRISKQTYEKAVESIKDLPTSVNVPSTTANPNHTIGFSCPICLDTGKETCGRCGGNGQIKYRKERSVWDSYRKAYKSEYYDEWYSCSNCSNGKVKCSSLRCPFR